MPGQTQPEGVYPANRVVRDVPTIYPPEVEFVRISYDADGYYNVVCLDEQKQRIDGPHHGHRAEYRIEAALSSEPEGEYNIVVPETN